MTQIKGECPKCKGKGYVTKYGSLGTAPFGMGVMAPRPPRPVVGLKTCSLCKGDKEVEVE